MATNSFIQEFSPFLFKILQRFSGKRNDAYDVDPEEILVQHVKPLVLMGTFPNKNESIARFHLKYSTVLFISGIFCLGSLLHLSYVLFNGLGIEISSDLVFVVSLITLDYVSLCIIGNKNLLLKFERKFVNSDFLFGLPPDFKKLNDMHLFIYTMILYIYVPINTIVYFSINYFYVGPICEDNNVRKGFNEACGLFSPAWFPWINLNDNILKHIYIGLQIFIFLTIVRGGAYSAYLVVIHVDNVCLKFNHLKDILVDVINNKNLTFDERDEKFNECIRYHHHILSLSEILVEMYFNMLGVHLMITSFNIAVLCYSIITSEYPTPGPALYLFGWVVAALLNSMSGQKLIDESSAISSAIYDSLWYELEPKHRKKLLMISLRSSKPTILPASSFGKLNLEMFVGMMKAAYMFLTMLSRSV